MPAPKSIPEPWNSFLRELDEKATEETRLDCMGGLQEMDMSRFARLTNELSRKMENYAAAEATKPRLNQLLQ